jgi:hypothetical protein
LSKLNGLIQLKGITDRINTSKIGNVALEAVITALDVFLLIEDGDIGLPLAPKLKALQARTFSSSTTT